MTKTLTLFIAFILVCNCVWSADSNPGWKKHVVVQGANGSINTANAVDFDDDGHVDVIASFDGGVSILKGPNWTQHLVHAFDSTQSRTKPRAGCIHSCMMDVDGDGDMDYCGSNLTVYWLECPDEAFSGKRWTYRTIDDEILGTHCLITADVDRDGKLDLIANSGRDAKTTTVPNSLTWQKIPADPHKADHWIRNVFGVNDAPGASHYSGFADVDGDGRGDISFGAKGGDAFPGGEWFAWWQQPTDPTKPWKKNLLSDKQPGATNIHPIDLNGDSKMDFFATRGHGKGVLWFKGPEFEAIEIDPSIQGPHCLVTVDLDEDGDIDAATVGKENDGIAVWYENDGQANFTRHLIDNDQGAYDLRAIDMDGDNDLDLLVAGHGSKNVVWYENPTK